MKLAVPKNHLGGHMFKKTASYLNDSIAKVADISIKLIVVRLTIWQIVRTQKILKFKFKHGNVNFVHQKFRTFCSQKVRQFFVKKVQKSVTNLRIGKWSFARDTYKMFRMPLFG